MRDQEFDEALADLEAWEIAQAREIALNSVYEDICAGFAAWRAYSPETYRPRMVDGRPLSFADYWIYSFTKTVH